MKLRVLLAVGEEFEVEMDPSSTIMHMKQLILNQKQYPLWSQKLVWNGKQLLDESFIEELGLSSSSDIHLIIKDSFVSKLHPLELLDPISGQLLSNPVTACDGQTYSESSLIKWKESFNGARMLSPVTGKNSKLTYEPNPAMKNRVDEYVSCMKLQDNNITNIDELGAVFSIIDHIREDLAEVIHDWKVPQIVVVGNESIGKSTLLERLGMMPLFPRGDRRCTRMKIEIRLRRGSDKNPRLTLYRYHSEGDIAVRKLEVAMETGSEGLQREMDSLINSDPNMPQICPDMYLVMEITNRRAPNIDLVDMPGLIATPEEEANLIEKMVTDHFDQHGEYSMYLFVIEATRNVNQSPIKLVKDRPEMEKNTLGVVTHVDKIDPKVDVDRMANLRKLATGEACPGIGGVSLNPHGFMLTMNASKESDDESGFKPIFQRAERENEFFYDCGFGDLVEGKRAGCTALISKLKSMYWDYLKKQWLPKTFSKIEDTIKYWENEDIKLGLPRAHIELDDEKHKDLADAVIKGIKQIFQSEKIDIQTMYEDECLSPLHFRLIEKLHSTTVPRIEVKKEIRSMRNSLIEVCQNFFPLEDEFWGNVMEQILKNDTSLLKLARFDNLISAYKEVFMQKLTECNVTTIRKIEEFVDFHLLSLNSLQLQTDNDSKLVTITPPQYLGETIRHIMSSNLHTFDETMLEDYLLEELLSGVVLIENCSDERFNALNKLELLNIAKKGLENLAELQGDTISSHNDPLGEDIVEEVEEDISEGVLSDY